MSGAAEGIAGLALSAVSVAALFTTCIECFDIIVAGKNFSEDYEQLCTLFSLQRARFGLWGESVGVIPNPCDGRRLRYDERIDRPDIRPGVERALNNINSLIQEAGRVDEKYGLKEEVSNSSGLSTSRGIDVFKAPFDRFKSRIRVHQKNTSAWKVTQWAIHDAKKFEALINRLEKLVDGLESITRSLGLLEQQHARLELEINSISDTESLRLLRDASSSHHSTRHDVSDAASRRLVVVAESITEQRTLASRSIAQRTGTTFITANSRAPTSMRSFTPLIPGAYPVSADTRSRAHTQCNSSRIASSEARQITDHPPEADRLENRESMEIDLPQNQRLLRSLVQNAKSRKPLSFAAGDADYGKRLAIIKVKDDENWLRHSGNLLTHAHSGSSAVKRMFFDLRNIRTGKIPFVSAAPVQDSLDRVLASIEGPPETPYEGGVFWITIKLSEIDPLGPPLMRFQTKIYHPNISPKGHICADYKENWNSVLSAGSTDGPVQNPADLWYRRKSGETLWSLGALLTALCGLLATPDVDDPLVPEIAQKYLEDYDGYCQNAKLYTQLYATGETPEERSLIFLEDGPKEGFDHAKTMLPMSKKEPDVDVVSLQRSLREIYDDSFPDSDQSLGFEDGNRSTWKMLPVYRDSFCEPHERPVFFNPTLKWDINLELPSEVVANQLTAYF